MVGVWRGNPSGALRFTHALSAPFAVSSTGFELEHRGRRRFAGRGAGAASGGHLAGPALAPEPGRPIP